MLFAVHCLDRPNSIEVRRANFDAHMAHLKATRLKIVISGPLLGTDHETTVGSFFLVDAPSMTDAEAFNRDDPYRRAGVWKQVKIHPFLKRIDNRN
jgi:uncharacterized protein YciI